MKFCKQCGSPINARTKKCDSFGKQYFTFRNKWIISLFVFILLFSVSLFSNLILFFSLKYAESENKGLHDELSDLSSLRDEYNSLLTKNSSLSSANKNLSESNKEKNDEISYWKDLSTQYEEKINFIKENAFFILTTDDTYYHRYGCTASADCYLVWNSSYSIEDKCTFCSRSYAISRGYIACPDCVQ